MPAEIWMPLRRSESGDGMDRPFPTIIASSAPGRSPAAAPKRRPTLFFRFFAGGRVQFGHRHLSVVAREMDRNDAVHIELQALDVRQQVRMIRINAGGRG